MQYRNVSPLGGVYLPTLGLSVKAGEIIETDAKLPKAHFQPVPAKKAKPISDVAPATESTAEGAAE